jgi:hypothetical protein
VWEIRPDPIGHLGGDLGRDFRAVERYTTRTGRNYKRNWVGQAKRVQEIHPSDVKKIVDEALPAGSTVPHALVLAVGCNASRRTYDKFAAETKARGVKRADLWDWQKVNDLLNDGRNARIASYFFGDGSVIPGTVPLPQAVDRSGGRDAPLSDRSTQVAQLVAAGGDVAIVGPAATGKTRLAAEVSGARYLTNFSTVDGIAESLRLDQPPALVLDDAGLHLDQLEMLLALQREGYTFRIIATTWPDSLDAVRQLLPTAAVITTGTLEVPEIDALLLSMNVTNYYLRVWIASLAEGRPGWAVKLADLAKKHRVADVVSGRGLLEHFRPYLQRLDPSRSDEIMVLAGVLAAIGPVDRDTEAESLDAFLKVGVGERQALVGRAAAVGLVDVRRGRLRSAPDALSGTLVGATFYGSGTALSIDAVLRHWPDRQGQVIRSVIAAALSGSAEARRDVDRLVPDVRAAANYLPIDDFIDLDERAATRALHQTSAMPVGSGLREKIVMNAARRYLAPEAVAALLDAALGDHRPEHQTPEHPVRVLGEIGRQLDPLGRSQFGTRRTILELSNVWLGRDPDRERQLVWAAVVAHLLNPEVEGNFPTAGANLSITLASRVETAEQIQAIKDYLWPMIEPCLERLGTGALVLLLEPIRDLANVARGFAGRSPAPTPDQQAAAQEALAVVLPALGRAAASRPGLQLSLQRMWQDYHIGQRQPLDPEFRLLGLGWHSRGALKEKSHLQHAIDRLVDRWLTEDPAAVMKRIAEWGAAARSADLDLMPVGRTALGDFGRRAPNVDRLVQAALDAGVGAEADWLIFTALRTAKSVPPWFQRALRGPWRQLVIAAALNPGSQLDAALLAVREVTARDGTTVDIALLRHGAEGHGAVTRALLRHRRRDVRGIAAVAIGLGTPHGPGHLPPELETDWKRAMLDAPIPDHGSTWELGQTLAYMTSEHPDLLADWLRVQFRRGRPIWRLDFADELDLSKLPQATRDRLIRRMAAKPSISCPSQDRPPTTCVVARSSWLATVLPLRGVARRAARLRSPLGRPPASRQGCFGRRTP